MVKEWTKNDQKMDVMTFRGGDDFGIWTGKNYEINWLNYRLDILMIYTGKWSISRFIRAINWIHQVHFTSLKNVCDKPSMKSGLCLVKSILTGHDSIQRHIFRSQNEYIGIKYSDILCDILTKDDCNHERDKFLSISLDEYFLRPLKFYFNWTE